MGDLMAQQNRLTTKKYKNKSFSDKPKHVERAAMKTYGNGLFQKKQEICFKNTILYYQSGK